MTKAREDPARRPWVVQSFKVTFSRPVAYGELPKSDRFLNVKSSFYYTINYNTFPREKHANKANIAVDAYSIKTITFKFRLLSKTAPLSTGSAQLKALTSAENYEYWVQSHA